MKNGYVLVDHHGDRGTVREGDVMPDLSDELFSQLEGSGLVREATDAELKARKADEPASNKAAPAPKNKAKQDASNKGA